MRHKEVSHDRKQMVNSGPQPSHLVPESLTVLNHFTSYMLPSVFLYNTQPTHVGWVVAAIKIMVLHTGNR